MTGKERDIRKDSPILPRLENAEAGTSRALVV
jgi:hypothetical protein